MYYYFILCKRKVGLNRDCLRDIRAKSSCLSISCPPPLPFTSLSPAFAPPTVRLSFPHLLCASAFSNPPPLWIRMNAISDTRHTNADLSYNYDYFVIIIIIITRMMAVTRMRRRLTKLCLPSVSTNQPHKSTKISRRNWNAGNRGITTGPDLILITWVSSTQYTTITVVDVLFLFQLGWW